MEKIYFEMNDKEKQLHHIGETIDYAICAFSEGLSGTGEYNIETEEVIELQGRIADQLLSVQTDIEKLLKAVEEKEEKPTLVFNAIGGREELKVLKNCTVYHIEDVENPEENFYGTEIIFHNEKTGKYIGLLKDDDGQMSLSQWY